MFILNSFIGYIGGKNHLKKEIYKRFPSEYSKYVEVFGGAAWVLFYKEKANFEVYNDINGELVNLFKCVKNDIDALKNELKYMLNSRQIFCEFKNMDNLDKLSNVQRAVRFYYILKFSYGGKMTSFDKGTLNIDKIPNFLDRIHSRLSSVIIENVDFDKLIRSYDSKDTIFYFLFRSALFWLRKVL